MTMMRQTRDIPSDLESAALSTYHVDELILSLAREIALDRVRRKGWPQVYQIYQLHIEWGWTPEDVAGFLAGSPVN
jgi:hypothetical protein